MKQQHWLSFILLALVAVSCKKTTIDLNPGLQSVLKNTCYVKTHNVSVISMGYPGFTTKNLQSVNARVIKAKPDLIIIMAGSNDVVQHQYDNYRNDLITLIDSLRGGQNADIMLLSPPAATLNGYKSFNLALISLGPVIKKVCDEKNCLYVDINAAFKAQDSYANPLLFTDNVHPTPAGYTVLASTVLKAYADNKLSKYTIVCFGDSITYGSQVEGAGSIEGDTYPAQLYKLLNN